MKSTLVMASGGIESNTLIAKAIKGGSFVIGLYFDLGLDSSDQQMHSAKTILRAGSGKLERIDIRELRYMLLEFMPPHVLAGEADKLCTDVEFMPLYTVIAVYYAECSGLKNIYLGFTRDQIDKKRASFFKMLGPTFSSYQEGLESVSIEMPFSKLDKADVIKLGHKLGVSYENSWSCLYGEALHCGICPRCTSRKEAFNSAKITDPTDYLS